MKKILYIACVTMLTACFSNYDKKIGRNRDIENLSQYWTVYPFNNRQLNIFNRDIYVQVINLPSNLISQGCDTTPNGRNFSFLFKDTPWNKEISFNNQNTFLIQQGKKVKLKPAYKYYNTWKEGTFAVSGRDKGRKYDSSFAFLIPCKEIITPDTIVHIGGIYEDGKELPPIEFKIFKKTDGQ